MVDGKKIAEQALYEPCTQYADAAANDRFAAFA